MGNFINFRDVTNVLNAGNGLRTAGTALATAVTNGGGPIEQESARVFKKTDEYSKGFWNDNYAAVVSGVQACEPRYLDLIHTGTAWATAAQGMGEDVVTAATRIVWQDAIAAAELSTAMVVST